MLFFAAVVRPFVTLFIGLRVRGRSNLPERDPFILIANHSSHLDTVSLLSLFPLRRLRKIHPCAAADYFGRTPLISFISHTFFNVLLVARTKITPESNPIPRMREALVRGESLILYPEGSRGTGETIAAFKTGIAHLLEAAPGVPVVPAYLVNTGRSLPKGEYLPVPFICEVRIGQPRAVHGSRKEIIDTLQRSVLELKEEE